MLKAQTQRVATVFINAISKPAEAKTEYVVLAEPAVTTNIASSQKKVVLDFKKEWQKIHGENSTFTQAGLVVNVSKVNKKYLQALVEHLKENRNYLYNNIADINSKLEDGNFYESRYRGVFDC